MKTKSKFIDFRQLKQQVTIRQILEHYDLLDDLEEGGDTLSGFCPVCEGEAEDMFRVSLSKNCWNCFGDCSGGNILDFVSQMESCSIRAAAVRIVDWFDLEFVPRKRTPRKSARKSATKRKSIRRQPEKQRDANLNHGSTTANKPLGFELELDPSHPWLDEMGLSAETVHEFGLGFCSKGYLKGHIAFPVHNREGEIVAYGGMSMNEDDPMNPEYLYPAEEKFNPSVELFGFYQTIQRGHVGVVYLVRNPLQVFLSWEQDGVSASCALSKNPAEIIGQYTLGIFTNCLV